MNPILVLREEVVCLAILFFLLFTSRKYRMGKDSTTFNRLACFAIIHVVFDVVTVLTVNRILAVPDIVNNLCHAVFYLSGILFANEVFHYLVRACYPQHARNQYILCLTLIGVYLLSLTVLKIDYVDASGTRSSSGPAAYVSFGLAFAFILLSAILIIRNRKQLPPQVLYALMPVLLLMVVSEAIQIAVREMLFTGAAITIVAMGFFFSLENPVYALERKAMTDALTGVHSRHRYDMDLIRMEEEFRDRPDSSFTFAFFDINNLRGVNRNYGHPEGDHYITFIAQTLLENLKHAGGLYRLGGDEFLAVYRKVSEDTVKNEIAAVKDACLKADGETNYIRSVSAGYAVSGNGYKKLSDVIRTADYMMYKDKQKKNNQIGKEITGTELNLNGLTDRLFNAMCFSNDRSYPYVTNMETRVTRISPNWMEYFGMPSEFYGDFDSVWLEKIHPDDRQAYIQDIAEVLSGKKRFHRCDYRALNKDGVYVACSCTGSVYHSRDEEADIFAGYLVNHGIEETVDAVTGLYNYHVLDSRIDNILGSSLGGIVIKLGINRFERINMMYSYLDGDELLRGIAAVIREEVGEEGEVFCQDGIKFTVFLPGGTRDKAYSIYGKISERLAAGVMMHSSTIPLEVSGGAAEIVPDMHLERKTIRSRLLYALDESAFTKHGKLVFYDIGDDQEEEDIFDLLRMIHRDAVNEKRFFAMRYQPIVDTETERVCGAEALIRWIHPDRGEIRPSAFIGFLENDPCYYSLGLFILRKSVRFAKTMRRTIPDFRISVNVTALQMQREDFVSQILEILQQEDYPPEGLIIELTERCKEMKADLLRSACDQIRCSGIRLSFDDMGTGYSTFDLLMNIPVDEVKLDCRFVNGLKTNKAYRIFVEALQRGGADRHFDVCFEGVETEEILEDIRSFGPSLCQGYYFNRPLTEEDYIRTYGSEGGAEG